MMPFEIVLRKLGNSTGITFPPSVLKSLKLAAGNTMTMDIAPDGTIILARKRRYILDDLIAQCNRTIPIPDDMTSWDSEKPVGQETL